VVGLLWSVSPAQAGPSGGDSPVTEEQLEYSKELFAQGEEAMANKDYQLAINKYSEAYRYAPHLHLFTYNIASAAEAAGDCRTAHYYFGQFLALVPEHPERKKVEKKVEKMTTTCPIDQESSEVVSTKSREERDRDRAKNERSRSMNEALAGLMTGQQMYEAGAKRFKDSKAFKKAASRKKRYAKRMKRMLKSHGVKVEVPESSAPQLPGDLKAACKAARIHEQRTIKALESVLEVFDTSESYRVINRFLRRAEKKDLPAFEDCSK
jgi:tetratricopeptide (TPR) repeat protein